MIDLCYCGERPERVLGAEERFMQRTIGIAILAVVTALGLGHAAAQFGGGGGASGVGGHGGGGGGAGGAGTGGAGAGGAGAGGSGGHTYTPVYARRSAWSPWKGK